MNSPTPERFPMKSNNPVLSWEFVILKLLLLALLAVMLEKPTGALAGRLALEQEGFNLYSYDMKGNHVYALAIGPRGTESQERGVWVNKDGTFKIDSLPVGEYELKVHVPGFATSYDSGIFVVEGKTTQLSHAVALQLQQPSTNIASNARVFSTHDQPRFWVNISGCSDLTATVYKADMLPLALQQDSVKKIGFEITPEFGCYKPYDSKTQEIARKFFSDKPVIRTWTRKITTDDYTHEDFKLEKPLPPGDYFVVAEGKNLQNKKDWNILWFSVSDLGLIVKQDPWQTLVRAVDLNTLRPVSGAQIKLLSRDNGAQMAAGNTGSDGFVTLNRGQKLPNGTSLVVTGQSGAFHAYGGMNYYSSGASNTYKTLFYTERPVYRLGQTVYFKGICRKIEENGLKNPGGNLQLKAGIEDPDNNEIWSGNLKTNPHGTFNGLFEIPNDGKTGAYQVHLTYPDGTEDYERFEVAEYRKPEYQVEVIPIASRVTAGAPVKARVRATYYFGAPVANAKVKYTVFSRVDWSTRYSLMDRPDYYGYFDGWDDEGDYEDTSYSGDYVTEGYTVTDATGEATVQFDTKRSTFDMQRPWEFDRYDHAYKVEAEVTDISRMSVLGSGSVSVTNGDFELFVSPSSYVAKVGESISADVSAVNYDGHKPATNLPVHLRLYRRVYDQAHYSYKGIEIFEDKTVNTDASGKAHVSFSTKPQFPTDTYEILATAEDSQHNVIADESGVWVVSDTAPYMLSEREASKEPFTVKLDKGVYQVGEKAKVMIVAPVTGMEGAQAIVSVEGPRLYNYKVVEMKATAAMVEVPVVADYAPDVYVTVTFIGKKRQFYNQSVMLKVTPKEHFLQVAIESDKPKYKPGEVASYTLKAQYSDGRPAANTELSLGIVDESIYAIRPDITPDIRSYFYDKRLNSVTTVCTFPEEYSGGPNKIEPRVRKDFRDTAAWMPVVITDAKGVAHATVKLPDNLTTWRATALAIDMNTNVGQARQKVVSTQDLILRLALPRFFSQGDEGVITAVVHNYTEAPQTIDLTLNASNEFKVKTALKQQLVVEPDKAKRYSWPVSVLSSGESVIACKAVGSTAGDAMQVKLPVRPLGVQSFVTKSGVITADDATINIPAQLPPDAVPGSAKLHLYLSSSTVGSMVGNFASLIDYPYGCTEQTMSKLMPSIVAVRLSQTLHVPLAEKDKAKFKKVYKQSMDKLNSYQHDDGGWGWWQTDTSQIYLTALVLDGYKQLSEAGYAVPEDRRDNGLKWLSTNCDNLAKQLSDPLLKADRWMITDRGTDLSRGVYVLSRYKKPISDTARKWALNHRDQMTPEPLAYFTMAFDNLGDHEVARAFFNRLMELGTTVSGDGGSTIDWSPSKAMADKIGWKYGSLYSYRYTDVETTALALEAMATMEPDNFDRLESVKRWILLQRGKDGWANTKTTSEVLRALTKLETGTAGATGDTDFTATIEGSQTKPLSFTRASITEPETDLSLDAKKSGTLSLHKTGHGRLYYTSVLTYYKQIKPGEFVAQKSEPDGLKIRREFFRLVPSAPDSNGNVHFTAQALADKTVRAGETVLMKVYVDTPLSVPYVLMEAPLPSGAEVVENDTRANADEESSGDSNRQEESPYPFGNLWWTHQDTMDDHLAFFVTELGRGKAELHQMVRMEMPGQFQMNPVTMEGMYSKAVRAYSQADELKVVE